MTGVRSEQQSRPARDERAGIGHNGPPVAETGASEEASSEAGDRVRALRARDAAAGVVSYPVRIPAAAKAAFRMLARIFRDGTPAQRGRVIRALAIIETEVLREPDRDGVVRARHCEDYIEAERPNGLSLRHKSRYGGDG